MKKMSPKKLTIKAIVEETGKQINKAMFVVKHGGIWKNGGYVPAPQPEVSAKTVAKALKEQGYDVEKIE